jgi:hypothetical protein
MEVMSMEISDVLRAQGYELKEESEGRGGRQELWIRCGDRRAVLVHWFPMLEEWQ